MPWISGILKRWCPVGLSQLAGHLDSGMVALRARSQHLHCSLPPRSVEAEHEEHLPA